MSTGSTTPALVSQPEAVGQPALQAHGLACFRGEQMLFRDVDIQLGPGEALLVHGPNGSGKTTLLRALCGLVLPAEGHIEWCGTDIQTHPDAHRTAFIYVGHADGVKLELSPIENLRFTQSLLGNRKDADLRAALERLGLEYVEDRPARTLSAGQRRRTALARLLIAPAALWILDEPFTALDKVGVALVEELLGEHLAKGGMTVLTSHQPVRLAGAASRELHLLTGADARGREQA